MEDFEVDFAMLDSSRRLILEQAAELGLIAGRFGRLDLSGSPLGVLPESRAATSLVQDVHGTVVTELSAAEGFLLAVARELELTGRRFRHTETGNTQLFNEVPGVA